MLKAGVGHVINAYVQFGMLQGVVAVLILSHFVISLGNLIHTCVFVLQIQTCLMCSGV